MFLLLCWAVCMSFVNKWRFLPAPGFSQNCCLMCRVIFLNKILENWKQLATLCKKLNLSVSQIQLRLRHISRWWKTFRSLFKALSSFPSSSSFGSTKQHFQYPEVKYTLWRCCMQGKAIDISLELRSVPAPRQDKRVLQKLSELLLRQLTPMHPPVTIHHCPGDMTRLCTDYPSATWFAIAPTVSWKKLVSISAGRAQALCRAGCWFREIVDGVFLFVFWLFLSTAWVLLRIVYHFLGGWLTITTVKGLQNLTWLFFSPSFLIKLPSLGKLLDLPSLT